MTQHEVNTFSNAYLLGNEAAQAKPDSMGLYQMAEAAGFKRDSLAWDAYVAGGCAFLFNGHTFETKAA